MANLDIRPLFKFPATVGALISFLEATQKSLRTGQVEPIRHFLEVRLQLKEDRQHLLSVINKWIQLLRLGMGETETGSHDMFGIMPVGFIPSKVKEKVVLHQVIEPSKAFTDKKTVPLKTKNVPFQVHKEKIRKNISLESLSIPPTVKDMLAYRSGLARVLVLSAMEELALSDNWDTELPLAVPKAWDRWGEEVGNLSYFQLLQDVESLTIPLVSEDQDGTVILSFEGVGMGLPLFLGGLLKLLPLAISRLQDGNYAQKYPRLLKALKAVQAVVEIIQSEQ